MQTALRTCFTPAEIASVVRAVLFVTTVFMGCSMDHLSATEYFEGRHLQAAQAIKSGNMEQLRLTADGLDVDKPGKREMTLLWFAIMEKNFEAIRVLIRLGSKPGEQIAKGLGVPVDYALLNKDLRFLRAMLDGGLPVNYATQAGTTLLHKAAGEFGASLDHVKLLVERGANLEARDAVGETPIYFALGTNQVDRAWYLLERGARLNVQTVRGASPAWIVHFTIEGQQPGSPMRRDFERLRDRMIAHGAQFPPDPPEKVRAWMKTLGMEVAE